MLCKSLVAREDKDRERHGKVECLGAIRVMVMSPGWENKHRQVLANHQYIVFYADQAEHTGELCLRGSTSLFDKEEGKSGIALGCWLTKTEAPCCKVKFTRMKGVKACIPD